MGRGSPICERVRKKQARAEGGALGARAPALFLNYSKLPLADK